MLDPDTVTTFASDLRGSVLRPDDAGYDEARSVWNGMVDRRPGLIVRCAGAADVMAAVDLARKESLPLSVRGGGHSVSGKAVCDDGIMLDLSAMNHVRVDQEARTADVGPGCRWADVDHETQVFGLATTGGVDSRTGVAGLTLGGGIGWLARSHGLALDNLTRADVVTADGRLVRADKDENEDLFWGLRGGGGNFGVVTNFQFRLHEVGPEVMVFQGFYRYGQAGEVLRHYRDFSANSPNPVACYLLIVHAPPAAPFPEEVHGKPVIAIVAVHSGDATRGKAALEPLDDFGDPIVKRFEPMPYKELQRSFDAGTPDGARYYYKSLFVRELSDEALRELAKRAKALPGPYSVVGIEPMGGAINRVAANATAFPHRNAAYNVGAWAGWDDPARDKEIIAWARKLHDAMGPWATGGVYANYMDQDADDQVRAAFRGNYDRLVELKRHWDPDNLFCMNQVLVGD